MSPYEKFDTATYLASIMHHCKEKGTLFRSTQGHTLGHCMSVRKELAGKILQKPLIGSPQGSLEMRKRKSKFAGNRADELTRRVILKGEHIY